ncbi:hypothetical protein PILCRDRAFT_1423 [Piloderma croceum F 1598]|uniref:Uncharacterized protein n=1 Tax=Piloderma croceum (strain F 1598) TaxID=765440 RepID=A0A0C3BXH6_PILCF|nr:hypothetical protein PILCRDRAFT_1423 [Piloderma croceum F 1598]
MSLMRFLLLWLLPVFVFSSSSHSVLAALPKGCTTKVKKSIDQPLGWVKQIPAPANCVFEMRIGLQLPRTQFGLGTTYPTPATFYSTGSRPPVTFDTSEPDVNTNEPYLDWLNYMLSIPNPALTISCSYNDDEQTVPLSYARRSPGARVSLLFASGESGVEEKDLNPTTQICFTNYGRIITRYRPGFPSTCPFVTSVGETTGIHETAANFSGGGFSDYLSRMLPSKNTLTSSPKIFTEDFSIGNCDDLYILARTLDPLLNLRSAIPDVSAQAEGFRIFLKGRTGKIGGTSTYGCRLCVLE